MPTLYHLNVNYWKKNMVNPSQKISEFTFVNCCVCGNNQATLVGRGKDFEYQTTSDIFSAVQCNSCGLIYLNPHPAISELKRIYPSSYHAYNFSKKEFGLVYKVRAWLEARRLLNHCHHLSENARILDVGCGDGFHLKLLRKFGKNGWTLEGIDVNEKAVQAATRSGFIVHRGIVEDIDLPKEDYDLVFLIMTIEHVEKPDKVLNAIKRLLKKGGRLVIVTDNTDSIDFKFFKDRYWGGYHFPRHWNLFNSHSLEGLAQKSGFEIMGLRTIFSPVNWVYSIHNLLVDKKRPRWLINRFTLRSTLLLAIFTVIDFILQKFGRGALLQGTLRKPDSENIESDQNKIIRSKIF